MNATATRNARNARQVSIHPAHSAANRSARGKRTTATGNAPRKIARDARFDLEFDAAVARLETAVAIQEQTTRRCIAEIDALPTFLTQMDPDQLARYRELDAAIEAALDDELSAELEVVRMIRLGCQGDSATPVDTSEIRSFEASDGRTWVALAEGAQLDSNRFAGHGLTFVMVFKRGAKVRVRPSMLVTWR